MSEIYLVSIQREREREREREGGLRESKKGKR